MGSRDEVFQVSVKGQVVVAGHSIVRIQIHGPNSHFSLDVTPDSAESLGLAIINMSKKVQIGARLVTVAVGLLGDEERAAELARVLTDAATEVVEEQQQIEVLQ